MVMYKTLSHRARIRNREAAATACASRRLHARAHEECGKTEPDDADGEQDAVEDAGERHESAARQARAGAALFVDADSPCDPERREAGVQPPLPTRT